MSTQDKDQENQRDSDAVKQREFVKRCVSEKDYIYWDSIIRRDTFRSMRHTLIRMGIPMYIPFNHVQYSHEYCVNFGDGNVELSSVPPWGWDASMRDDF